jgi:hypothetical protein
MFSNANLTVPDLTPLTFPGTDSDVAINGGRIHTHHPSPD